MTTTAPTSWFPRLTRFAGVGVLTTVLFLGVYLAFRTALPTTGAVTVAGTGGSLDELGVLIVASAVAGVVRFALMGRWVFPATA